MVWNVRLQQQDLVRYEESAYCINIHYYHKKLPLRNLPNKNPRFSLFFLSAFLLEVVQSGTVSATRVYLGIILKPRASSNSGVWCFEYVLPLIPDTKGTKKGSHDPPLILMIHVSCSSSRSSYSSTKCTHYSSTYTLYIFIIKNKSSFYAPGFHSHFILSNLSPGLEKTKSG